MGQHRPKIKWASTSPKIINSNQLIIFICCRTWIAHVLHANERKGKTQQRTREDYLEWRGVLVVVCGGLRWRRRWRCCFSSSSPCRGANPCVLSFSFSFYFPFLSCPLSVFSLFLYFFSFFPPLVFFLSLCFLFFIYFFVLMFLFFLLFPSLLLSSLVFKGKIGGREGDVLPLPSRGAGVGWSGRPLCSDHCAAAPRGTSPLFFHHVASK